MKIDFILNICCPWSYIVWRQLQNALTECRIEAGISPFFVSSGSFFAGFDITPAQKTRILEERLRPVLEENSLFIDFDNLPDPSGDLSRPAHLAQAAFSRKNYNVLNELFAAFFAFGQDITATTVLKRIAGHNGLTEKDYSPFRTILPDGMPEGLRAVPCLIFEKRTVLFGGQSVPCLKNMLYLSGLIQKENAFMEK